MLRVLWVLLVAIPVTIVLAIRIVWATALARPDAGPVCERIPRAWARSMLWAAGVRVELVNTEVIDPRAAQILIANHVSWFDVLALAAWMPGPYRFVAKKELQRVWFFGPAAKACGHIFIDRQDRQSAIESLQLARRRLEEEGPTVIMFPEGTRSADGRLQAFKKGAFVLAIQTGSDLVPAAIEGSREIMRKGSFRIRPGTVTVRFGSPIPVAGYTVDRRDELTERARGALMVLLAGGDADGTG